jgi:hypothetical protein
MLYSTYKRFLAKRASYVVTHKGGKGKGKGAKVKPRWLPQEAQRAIEEAEFDLLMLPHPTLVHRENETYVLIGHGNFQVRVTKENWNTLRFNTKTFNPEYFSASYLRPVPTVLSEDGASSTAKFPRSTINETLEDFLLPLLAPVLFQKSKKISPEDYRVLSLNRPAGERERCEDLNRAPRRGGRDDKSIFVQTNVKRS